MEKARPTRRRHDDEESEEQGPRRVRLRPREGAEHRFGFARRWEARRRARKTNPIWMLVTMDAGIVLLVYLLAREVIRRINGE